MLYKSRLRKPDINNIRRLYPDSRVTSVRLECKMCTTRVPKYMFVSLQFQALYRYLTMFLFDGQTISIFAYTRANQLAKYSSNVVHTLHYNCNNKTRLGVYQRYYSVLCNTLPYPVKQREALCENYRITYKYTYEVGEGKGGKQLQDVLLDSLCAL